MSGFAGESAVIIKQRLRQQMITQRENLTVAECRQAAAGFRQSLLDLVEMFEAKLPGGDQPLRLAAYCAIRQEADLSLAWPDLQAKQCELYFPAVKGSGRAAKLFLARLPVGCPPDRFLAPGCFGIAEPPPEAWLQEPPALDIVLLPGLAFDRAGNRLGWGRAFYDNLIPALPGRPVLAGVCYDFQIVPGLLPAQPNDQPVDWLLTPGGLIAARQ
jgi:5-formyltetrahydrofolate cyclo-ligase